MKWEYKVLKLKAPFGTENINSEELQSKLNEYGAQGWEVCGTYLTRVGFFRKQELRIVLKRNA